MSPSWFNKYLPAFFKSTPKDTPMTALETPVSPPSPPLQVPMFADTVVTPPAPAEERYSWDVEKATYFPNPHGSMVKAEHGGYSYKPLATTTIAAAPAEERYSWDTKQGKYVPDAIGNMVKNQYGTYVTREVAAQQKKTTPSVVTSNFNCHKGNTCLATAEVDGKAGGSLWIGGWSRGAHYDKDWAVIDATGNEHELKAASPFAVTRSASSAFEMTLQSAGHTGPWLALPIKDYSTPNWSLDLWQALATEVWELMSTGIDVLVACQGGHGRSGLVCAILVGIWDARQIIRLEEEPIACIRHAHCHEAVETAAQEDYIYAVLANYLEVTGGDPAEYKQLLADNQPTRKYGKHYWDSQYDLTTSTTSAVVGATSFTRFKDATCGVCYDPAVLECDTCGERVCAKHALIPEKGKVLCSWCSSDLKAKAKKDGEGDGGEDTKPVQIGEALATLRAEVAANTEGKFYCELCGVLMAVNYSPTSCCGLRICTKCYHEPDECHGFCDACQKYMEYAYSKSLCCQKKLCDDCYHVPSACLTPSDVTITPVKETQNV